LCGLWQLTTTKHGHMVLTIPGWCTWVLSGTFRLISNEEIIGTLALSSTALNAYTNHQVDLAERVSAQIAGAIANAQLHTRLDIEAREKEVLAEIGQVISSSLNIEEVYQQFSELVSRVIPFDRLSIAIINAESNTSRVSYMTGLNIEGRQPGDEIPLAGSLVGRVAESHGPTILQNLTREEISEQLTGFLPIFDAGIRSSIAVPLIQADVFVAVMQVRTFADGAYDQHDATLAQRVGDQIAGAIANSLLYTERQVAESALHETEEKYRVLVENSNDSIVLVRDGKVVYCNSAFENLLGYSLDDLPGIQIDHVIVPEQLDRVLEYDILRQQGKDVPEEYEIDLLTREGFRVAVEMRPRLIEYQGQDATMIVIRDVSERKLLEEQLFQAQKMESIGKLAGGVAHDFNNLLSAILGFTQLAASQLAVDERVNGRYLDHIETAAERGAGLVRQLLAFSRRQIIAPKNISANEQIRNLDPILLRLIGEHVDLNLELSPDAGMMLVDPGQMDQVLMNLAVNARDAMPTGGRLTIKTESVVLGIESMTLDRELSPGNYVVIKVTDDGIGMSASVAARVFEPFFTTKSVGEGTGLGLSTCYGIVKQNHGHITLHTQLGSGTTFKIFIPKSVEPSDFPNEIKPKNDVVGGSETVLLVEDEEAVREFVVEALQIQEYKVLEASNGVEDVEKSKPKEIELLLTDVVMPFMGGKELAASYRASFPDGKIIYMSGYSDDLVAASEISGPEGNFLQKPISLSELATKLRSTLDE
jgi:two-component system cell cycle sensor histidine kinase/response regulator CckA